MKYIPVFILLSIFMSCAETTNKNNDNLSAFNVKEIKPMIKETGKKWGIGLKEKDVSVFLDLYDKDAHYLPDADHAIHGNKNIAEYWKASMDFLTDVQLDMETLEGNKDLLYETGNGIAMVLNQTGGTDTLRYKYVNVWKRQNDGTYKVVIDTYNDIKR